ncbi:uncharacterized protein NPIL_436691 [Nephila pilipes]|uniref:Translation initiation factor 3 N-terminal domain-containing protein n=1 Tax=Nephila pilipes TaxID=299642 RepID=A0A8X6NCB5_NEPPI|nr:uncharacterized protein NPIL_436691 [Nephila pilipes]
MLKVINSISKINYLRCYISTFNALRDEEKKKPKKKVSETIELVTLVDTNDKILGLKPKPETEKLARKLNLILERVDDPKYGKMYPAYKLVSSADLLKEESKTSTSKVLKKLPINCRISDHDLVIKLKIVQNWLTKNCEVHVAVTGSEDMSGLKRTVFEKIQEHLKDQSKIINIRKKEDAIKCIVLPLKSPPANQKNKEQT